MDKTILAKMAAYNAAKGQEELIRQHRDFTREKRELERRVEEYKMILVDLESQLDFSTASEQEGEKATGRLRLADDSYQLTKTFSVTARVDSVAALKNSGLVKDLESLGFVVHEPVLKTKEALADETGRRLLLPFTTQQDTIRITATFEPR